MKPLRNIVFGLWLGLAGCGGGGGPPPTQPPLSPGADLVALAHEAGQGDETNVTDGRHENSALEIDSERDRIQKLLFALEDFDGEIREDAVEALGDRGDPRAIPGLQRAVYSENRAMRLSVIEALGEIRTDEAALALGELLIDEDANIREAAVTALSDFRREAVMGYLEFALADASDSVRAAAAEAIEDFMEHGCAR